MIINWLSLRVHNRFAKVHACKTLAPSIIASPAKSCSFLQLYEKLFRYFKMWAKLYVWARVCCVVTYRVQNSWRPGRWTCWALGTSICSEGEPPAGMQQRYTGAPAAKCALATESWTRAVTVYVCTRICMVNISTKKSYFIYVHPLCTLKYYAVGEGGGERGEGRGGSRCMRVCSRT